MKKTSISSDKAPKAASFFSQAILTASKYNLELSGQIGLDPLISKLVEGGIAEQTEQAFSNVEAVLSELNWTLDNITKAKIYLTSMNDYTGMNDVYESKFGDTPPARAAIAVKELPLGALVEIECVATGDEVPDNISI
jgi:2-iminobutanoate/2-iminopropanoate deaminase